MTRAAESHRTVLTLSSLNLAGKVLAVGKTLIIATLYGTSSTLDAFWVAYSLPLMLPTLLTTVITVAFVPRFVKNLDGRTGPEAWAGANTLFTLSMACATVAAVLIYLHPLALVSRLAPGLDAGTREQAAAMVRMMLPCMLMLTASSLLSALSNARERFVLSSLDGIVNNLAIIAIAATLSTRLGVHALIVGITIGFALQLLILCAGNRDLIASSLRPALHVRHPDFLRPLAHMVPLLVGSLGATLTNLINQYFVSKLDAGSISALTYATMIAMLPVEVFAQAVITSYYPALGRGAAAGDRTAVAATYRRGQRVILLLTLPCSALLVALAQPIVILLLEHGRFDTTSTALTVEAMSILAVSMVFRSMAYFSYRVLHGMIMPWTQVAIGLAGVATNIALNMMWTERLGLRGVALSTLVSQAQSALIAAFVVGWLLRTPPSSAERRAPLRLLPPVAILVLVLVLERMLIPADLYETSHRLWALVACATAIPAALAALWAAAWMGIPEASLVLGLARRLRR